MSVPPPQLRMMQPAFPPMSAPQLVMYGGRQPAIPRPAMAPLPLAAGQVHATSFNVPPPRQFPCLFSFVDYSSEPIQKTVMPFPLQ